MREIKFRAWDIVGKYMIDSSFGDWVSFDGIHYRDADNHYDTPNIEIQKVKTETILMQFTGLKDKNEKEIYEGDIIELRRFNLKSQYEVKWDDTYACFFGIHAKREGDEFGVYTHKLGLNESLFVIGNIYENPELLN